MTVEYLVQTVAPEVKTSVEQASEVGQFIAGVTKSCEFARELRIAVSLQYQPTVNVVDSATSAIRHLVTVVERRLASEFKPGSAACDSMLKNMRERIADLEEVSAGMRHGVSCKSAPDRAVA